MISKIIELGKRIYDTSNPREKHRFVVFVGRSLLHRSAMRDLYNWFMSDDERRKVLEVNPFPMEQVTRAFFYKEATFSERVEIKKNHYSYLLEKVRVNDVLHMSMMESTFTPIWSAQDEGEEWTASLMNAPGNRKEGMMTLVMHLGGMQLYQVMFWLGYNKKNEPSLYIGAMQGPNMDGAKDIVKEATKRAHRYRTKNLIIYMTMAVARALKAEHIYAVSNEGYYAMNHVRRNRKLKTDFGAFWEEVGGHITDDPRFYVLPLVEERKTMEEVPTRKRAVYRKRFAFQDDVDAQIAARMEKIMK